MLNLIFSKANLGIKYELPNEYKCSILQLSSLQSHSMDESSYCHQNDILFRTDQNDQKKESSLKGEEITII